MDRQLDAVLDRAASCCKAVSNIGTAIAIDNLRAIFAEDPKLSQSVAKKMAEKLRDMGAKA